MTLNGTAKLIRVVGVYVGLVGVGATGSWFVNEALTGDDGVLWPAKAKRQIGHLDAITERQQVEIDANTQGISTLKEDVRAVRTAVEDVQSTTTAILRAVCLEPTFGRSVECRKVYR